jgi:hypothetical protein
MEMDMHYGHRHAAWTSTLCLFLFMSMLHFVYPCLYCISQYMQLFHVRAACLCSCCMLISMLRIHVHATWPCPCCMSRGCSVALRGCGVALWGCSVAQWFARRTVDVQSQVQFLPSDCWFPVLGSIHTQSPPPLCSAGVITQWGRAQPWRTAGMNTVL